MTKPHFDIRKVSGFQIAESKTFCRCRQQLDSVVYDKIKDFVYPRLKKNPFYGPNIRQLTDELAGYHRFRTDDYRLFYLIKQKQSVIVIVALQPIRRGE